MNNYKKILKIVLSVFIISLAMALFKVSVIGTFWYYASLFLLWVLIFVFFDLKEYILK